MTVAVPHSFARFVQVSGPSTAANSGCLGLVLQRQLLKFHPQPKPDFATAKLVPEHWEGKEMKRVLREMPPL
jgi:hypothetical protein